MADPGTPFQVPDASDLARVLLEVQRRGGIGRGPVHDAIEHAQQYVAALPVAPGLLVDLGSGGGLPGVVIAASAPAWRVVLVERRHKRADLLRYALRSLGLDRRADVLAEDVDRAAMRPALRGVTDVVTARSFGPPLTVLAAARPFLTEGGQVLISEPPDGAPRWTVSDLVTLGMTDGGRVSGVRRFLTVDEATG